MTAGQSPALWRVSYAATPQERQLAPTATSPSTLPSQPSRPSSVAGRTIALASNQEPAPRATAPTLQPLPLAPDEPPANLVPPVEDAGSPPELQPLPTDSSNVALTLADVELIAVHSNPSIGRARALLTSLEGKLEQVGLPPNPTIGYSGQEIGDTGTAGMQGGYVRQQVVLGQKLKLNRAVVAQEILRAQQQLAAQEQRVLTDVRMAFYDAAITRRRVEVLRDLVKASEQAAETSERLYEAKEIPLVGVLQTQIESQNAVVLLQQAETQAVAAWRSLAAVLGEPERAPQPLSGNLDPGADLDWESQLQRLVVESPEMATGAASLERARFAVDRAVVQAIPDVSLQVGLTRDNVGQDTLTNVQVELPLPLWNKNQGGVRQARSRVVAAELNLERLQLNLTQRLAEEFQRYQNARQQVRIYDERILPKAQQNFDLVTQGYNRGQVGNLDMLTAQRLFFEAVLSRIDALQSMWRSRLRIEGLLLEGSLEVEDPVDN